MQAGWHGGSEPGLGAWLPPVLAPFWRPPRRWSGSARPSTTCPKRVDPFRQDIEITSDQGWAPLGLVGFSRDSPKPSRIGGVTPCWRKRGERFSPSKAAWQGGWNPFSCLLRPPSPWNSADPFGCTAMPAMSVSAAAVERAYALSRCGNEAVCPFQPSRAHGLR